MYKYDLHMHTKEGSLCSSTSVHDMIKSFKKLGFSGAVVTNHFLGGNTSVPRNLPWEETVDRYCLAYTEGLKTAKALDFDLLFGMEQGYGNGKEILIYGITPQFLIERPQLRSNDLALWSREVHSVGGFIAFAHPFRDRGYIKDPTAMPDLSLADGVEGYNFCNSAEENRAAIDTFKNKDTIIIAGSDLHNDDFSSAFGVVFNTRIKTGEELVKHLKSKNFELAL